MRIGTIYWPVVLACLWVLAWFLTGAPGERILLPLDPVNVTVYLAVLGGGMVIAAASRILINGGPEMDRQAVVWVAVMICAILGHQSRDRIFDAYDRIGPQDYSLVALTTAQREKTLPREWDGHYRLEVRINDGLATPMLVDTGASMVLIPYDMAPIVGIDPERLRYTVPVTTANGRSWVAPVTLSSIQVGEEFVVLNVEAAVAMPDVLQTGLLGMSFLERLEETTFRRGKLILRY